ncbi:Ig-like domain-containing protein [Nocardioides dubius]|uniref:Bacterial Ig-like domain-containing protein n=1 Tax=Nocardioides dubius TaxID=317019 RepID=A0ABN1U1L5_9ACTN
MTRINRRRLVPVLVTTVVGATLSAAVGLGATPAHADVNAPAANAVLRGTATLGASGASEGTLCANKDKPRTILQLLNSSNAVVATQTKDGSGAFSYSIDTHSHPNGAYTVRAEERNRTGTVLCSNNTKVTTRAVSIDNIVEIDYTGALSAAQNTVASVSARLADPHLAGNVLAGQPVVFSISGGGSVTATTNAQGVASASLPIAGPPRAATVTAQFVQTAFYRGDSASAPFTVGKNASAISVLPPAEVVHGQPTSFTAQVAAVNGTDAPGGQVQFLVDGDDFGAPATVQGGVAVSPSTDALSTGDHAITARYLGDGNFLAATAAAQQLRVGKAATSTTLDSDRVTTVSGQAVTFTATVSVLAPGAGTLGGAVQFDIDGQPYGTAVALSGDTATLTVSNLAPGNHHIEATYNGTADFAASASGSRTHGVDRAATSLDLASSVGSPVAGQPITWTATVAPVAPGAGEPSGEVQFFADGEPVGAPVDLVDGVARSAPTGLHAGARRITADYAGESRFAGSTAQLDLSVAAAQTSTEVTVAPSPSVVGQSVTLRAVVTPVSPARGEPAGAIQFLVDGVAQGMFVELEDGVAELSLGTLTRGEHVIRARYLSGDPDFVTSTSAPVSHQVNKAATRVEVESTTPVAVFGQPVTVTGRVAVVAPGAGSPSGTLTFTEGGVELGSVPVGPETGFQGALVLDELSVGSHVVTVSFDGDDSFQGAEATLVQKVQRAQTSVVVTSSDNPVPTGSPVRFTATASPVAPGAGEVGGTVRFTVNGAPLGGARAIVDGVATSPEFSSLTPGRYTIEAAYSGDASFVASAGVLDQGTGQQVTQGATEMSVTSGPSPAEDGAPVTVTATVSALAPSTTRPTGTVQVWADSRLLGAASLVAAGPRTATATVVTTALEPGNHTLRADYLGNFNYQAATASTQQAVARTATVTGLWLGEQQITFGDDVELSAAVDAADGSLAGGTVAFRSGATVLGTAELVAEDGRMVARITAEGLGGGEHAITAHYAGDQTRAASVSAAQVLVVQRAATSMTARYVINDVGPGGIRLRGTLLDGAGQPLSGQVVRLTSFNAYTQVRVPTCADQVSDADGGVVCEVPLEQAGWGGYEVAFLGSPDYLPAEDSGFYLGDGTYD